MPDKDVQATVIELTARSIFNNIPQRYKNIYVCGGGKKNTNLINRMQIHAKREILSTESLGWMPESIEASCFAWLAAKAISRETFSLEKITGADKKGKIGSITFA